MERSSRGPRRSLHSVVVLSALLTVPAVTFLLGGCVTPAQNYTTRSPNSADAARPLPVTLSLERPDGGDGGDGGERRATLTSKLTPSLTFVGDAVPAENGTVVIYLTELRIFTNWANGWTEGRYEASGNLELTPAAGAPAAYTITVTDPPALWSVVEGEVRYYDTYYRGDDGVAKVRARVDRLRELSRLLREEFDLAPMYWSMRRGGGEARPFHGAVYPLLFPELTDGDLAPSVAATVEATPEELLTGPTVIGSDIAWATRYTEAVFPDNLHELRNSGTIFRDYEEAFELFYSFYNLNHFTTELSGTVVTLE